MSGLFSYALNQPATLAVPAVGLAVSLCLMRLKTRYITQGLSFGRSNGAFAAGAQTSPKPQIQGADAETKIRATTAPVSSWNARGDDNFPKTIPDVGMDLRLLHLAIEGLLNFDFAVAPALIDEKELLAMLKLASNDWKLLRGTMSPDLRGTTKFEYQIFRLDFMAELVDKSTGEQKATTQSLASFKDALHSLQRMLANAEARSAAASSDGAA
jgi:hypothetical protein